MLKSSVEKEVEKEKEESQTANKIIIINPAKERCECAMEEEGTGSSNWMPLKPTTMQDNGKMSKGGMCQEISLFEKDPCKIALETKQQLVLAVQLSSGYCMPNKRKCCNFLPQAWSKLLLRNWCPDPRSCSSIRGASSFFSSGRKGCSCLQ